MDRSQMIEQNKNVFMNQTLMNNTTMPPREIHNEKRDAGSKDGGNLGRVKKEKPNVDYLSSDDEKEDKHDPKKVLVKKIMEIFLKSKSNEEKGKS